MSTEYYVYGDTLLPNTVARSTDVKAEFQAIETGLAKLPTPTELKLGTTQYGAAGGVADAYTVTLPYTPAAYAVGMTVAFKASAANTGSSTVNVNALGVKSIKRPDGAALQAGDITTSAVTLLAYNGTDFIILNALPGVATAAAASASAAQTAQTNAETAETNAETAEVNAEAAQAAAEAAQAAAEAAQLAAVAAKTAAETAEANAETAETNAETAETNAEAAQLAAEAARDAAQTAQGLAEAAQAAAETAETNAETAETNAEAAQLAAETAWDSFDDRYLGAKAADPALDNDGNALLTGALYFNTAANEMRVYTGAAWVAAYVGGASYLPLTGGTVTGATEFQNDLNVTGTLKIGSTAVTATAAELNYLDISTIGTMYASKALTASAGNVLTVPSGGQITLQSGSTFSASGVVSINGSQVTATGTELNYCDITTLGTMQASKALTANASNVATVPSGGTVTFNSGSTLNLNGTTSCGADIDLNNNDIGEIKTATFNAEYDNGNSSTAKTITLTNGQKQKVTLTGNATLTISATSALTGHYQLRLIQDATGSRSVTWSGISSTQWLGETSAPDINSTANSETIVNIFVSGSTVICASAAKVGAV